jgi:PAS domain S-box-containing protein
MDTQNDIPASPFFQVLPSSEEGLIMVWRTNEQHLCDYVNKALLKYVGADFEGFSGLNWLNLVHNEDRARVEEVQSFSLKYQKVFRNEYRVRTASGEYRWVLDLGVPRFSPQGKFLGYIGSAVDIHDQKTRELQLIERQKKLEEEILQVSDREQSRIGQDLHDGLSQKLLAVALKAELLKEKLFKTQVEETCLAEEIIAESNETIRETRRVARNLSPLSLEKNGLRIGLEEMAHQLKETFGVGMRLQCEGDESRLDTQSAFHIYRIVQSALSNSIGHGKANEIVVRLDLSSPGKGLLIIEDNGGGLASHWEKNRGIGLYLMEYRARMMEGKISMDSIPGGGARIVCEFKLDR